MTYWIDNSRDHNEKKNEINKWKWMNEWKINIMWLEWINLSIKLNEWIDIEYNCHCYKCNDKFVHYSISLSYIFLIFIYPSLFVD